MTRRKQRSASSGEADAPEAGRVDDAVRTSTLDLAPASEFTPILALTPEETIVLDVLEAFERVLTDEEPGADVVERLLARLPAPDAREHPIAETRTRLSSKEIRDYDRYFDVRHVETEAKALAQTRSLLETCLTFLRLRTAAPDLDPEHLAVQRDGFREYARVLRRSVSMEKER